MAQGKILPYLDMPLQNSSPEILKRMKRPAHTQKTLDRINKWRDICTDITIRSTFIVGFPGETEADFEHLLGFAEKAQQVIIDAINKDENYAIGRTKYDVPEVDGQVIIGDVLERNLKVGEFATVEITESAEYDLIAD